MRRVFRLIWATRRRRILLVGGVLMLVFSLVSVELTSRSSFCKSCHIMQDYYDSWKTSSHADVECIQCHIAPGFQNVIWAKLDGLGQVVDDLLHRTSTKPSASVSDFACTRSGCHAIEDVRAIARGPGQVTAVRGPDGKSRNFFFDHARHLDLEYRGIEIHCSTCHSHVRGDRHFEVNTNVCVTCHLHEPGAAPKLTQLASAAGLEGLLRATGGTIAQSDPARTDPASVPRAPNRCQSCHEPPAETIQYQGLTVVHEEYLAYGASCESCHRGATEKFQTVGDSQCLNCHTFGRERVGDVQELHRVHTVGRRKVECFSCHGVTRHGPDAQAMKLEQIDCRDCHASQHQVQQIAYKWVPSDSPPNHVQPTDASAVTPMFMAHVDCTGCHVQPRELASRSGAGATVAAATPQACDSCHKPGLGEQMVPLWQKTTRSLYERAVGMLPASDPPVGSAEHDRVRQARQLLDLVRLDGSWGVHNPRYTEGLIEQAMALLRGRSEEDGRRDVGTTRPEVAP